MDIHEPQAACASSYRVQQPVLRTPSALLLSSSREDATELASGGDCSVARSPHGGASAATVPLFPGLPFSCGGGVMSYFRLSPLATSRQ
jgi:hypothetical protein